jgi:hypothetical protein
MPDGLKLSHPLPIPSARSVSGKLRWTMIRRHTRRWEVAKMSLFHRE